MGRHTVATINLRELHYNLDLLIDTAQGSKVVAVVKADAYGNGAVEVAFSIEDKVDILAVAFLAEAHELRAAGIRKPILILQGPHIEADLYSELAVNVIWMLHSEWQLQAYSLYMQGVNINTGKPSSNPSSNIPPQNDINAWLKFDTGMHRLGLPIDDLDSLLSKYASIINDNTVLVTHLANADEPIQKHATAQIDKFLAAACKNGLPLCIANSATTIRYANARRDYVRLGIAMYGSTPFQTRDNPIDLHPVMTLEAPIIALRTIPKGDTVGYGSTWRSPKESLIATVAIGYADGYPRHAPTSTPAWCNGTVIGLVGRVSMDMLTFDVSDIPNVEIGDVVQLWGKQLPINDVAEHVGTIGYELMTRVSKRVPRIYIK